MMSNVANGGFDWSGLLRKLAWGGAALLLLLPLVAMQFTREVNWGPGDFLVMGALLSACAYAVDRATRISNDLAYLSAAVIAVGTSFLLVWVNLAVGIIGSEGNPANLMFAGVILVALAGSVAARFRAAGMARAMFAAALAQAAVAALTWFAGWGASEPPGEVRILALIGFFVLPWLLAGGLFRVAARRQV